MPDERERTVRLWTVRRSGESSGGICKALSTPGMGVFHRQDSLKWDCGKTRRQRRCAAMAGKLSKVNLNDYKPLRDVIFDTLREAIIAGSLNQDKCGSAACGRWVSAGHTVRSDKKTGTGRLVGLSRGKGACCRTFGQGHNGCAGGPRDT